MAVAALPSRRRKPIPYAMKQVHSAAIGRNQTALVHAIVDVIEGVSDYVNE